MAWCERALIGLVEGNRDDYELENTVMLEIPISHVGSAPANSLLLQVVHIKLHPEAHPPGGLESSCLHAMQYYTVK